MHTDIKRLKIEFHGRGEVSGFTFCQVESTKAGYIYQVTHPDDGKPHYEVFRHKANRRFKTISYPSALAFGIWAWNYPTLIQAREKLAELSQIKTVRIYLA